MTGWCCHMHHQHRITVWNNSNNNKHNPYSSIIHTVLYKKDILFVSPFWLNLPLFRRESTSPTPEMSSPPHLILFWKEIGLTTLTTSDYSQNSPCEEIKRTSFPMLPCQHTALQGSSLDVKVSSASMFVHP